MARHQAREAGTWTWTVTSPSSPGNVPQLPKWHRVLASCNCQKVTSKNGGTILPDMYLEGTSEETHHVARWICFVRGAKKMQSTFTNSPIANSGSSKTPGPSCPFGKLKQHDQAGLQMPENCSATWVRLKRAQVTSWPFKGGKWW